MLRRRGLEVPSSGPFRGALVQQITKEILEGIMVMSQECISERTGKETLDVPMPPRITTDIRERIMDCRRGR